MIDEVHQTMNDKPMNILLVEDNEADVKITLRAFSKAKLKNNIQVVSDGREALDYLSHQEPYADKKAYPRPDLILLDISMPQKNGFEVLKELKGSMSYKSIPVIMLTSSKNESDIAESYKNGAASYIQKPVNYDEFLKVIDGFNFYWHIINKLP